MGNRRYVENSIACHNGWPRIEPITRLGDELTMRGRHTFRHAGCPSRKPDVVEVVRRNHRLRIDRVLFKQPRLEGLASREHVVKLGKFARKAGEFLSQRLIHDHGSTICDPKHVIVGFATISSIKWDPNESSGSQTKVGVQRCE